MTQSTISDDTGEPTVDNYQPSEVGFVMYLHDLADHLFPFPGYREGQGEALRESLEALYVNGYDNVILDLPTGVGKSPINVTIGRVTSHLAANQMQVRDHFGIRLGLQRGDAFYTTPQKQLRNQLANDDDLSGYVSMLKARGDYICRESGEPCDECHVRNDPETSCMKQPGCTYWAAKMRAREDDIAALTFAMLIVDGNLPPETEEGHPISFRDRDVVIVDEGHNLEQQAASLFAGFTVSPWSLPDTVYKSAGDRADWDADRFEDVRGILTDLGKRAREFIRENEDVAGKETEVEQCENFLRKYNYALQEIEHEDRPWVVNIEKTRWPGDDVTTKKIELKPVDVDRFLQRFVWNRGTKRVISSATIPYRDKINVWANRIGLTGDTKLISRPMPFPEEHRLIHTSTIAGSMSGDDEDKNWGDAIAQIEQIHERHRGENGLIHTNSYDRAERVQQSLGSDKVIVHDNEKPTEQVIQEWNESDRDILATPSMTEGVDLYEDRCRWQVLLKTPYPYVADSRVSYLLNERKDWQWYMETASMDIQQSVGRAVRGPEPEEAASYYVVDSGFKKVIFSRTNPPAWFTEAIRGSAPDHWMNPDAAPWR